MKLVKGLNCPIPEKLFCVNETQPSYSPAVFYLTCPADHFVSQIVHQDETSAGDGSPQKRHLFCFFVCILQVSFAASCATVSFSAAFQDSI